MGFGLTARPSLISEKHLRRHKASKDSDRRTRQAVRAVSELLERRLFLTVTASVSGASSVNEASAYTLNLSASSSSGAISSWAIDWGDGPTGTPDVVTYSGNPGSESHTYAKGPTNETITATATDSTSATASATQAVSVNHVAPSITLSGATYCGPVQEGSAYDLSLTAAEATPSHAVSSWTVDWGDGSSPQSFAPNSHSGTTWSGYTNHTYNTAGNFTITATATDDVGTYSKTYALSMPHTPPALLVSRLARTTEGSSYTLNLAGSEVGTETITSWAVNWGDGTTSSPDIVVYNGNPSSVSHVYADGPSNYTISATASDQLGMYQAVVNLDGAFGGTGRVTTDLGSSTDFGYAAAVQADGKTVVVGTSNGNFALVRYNTDGSLDTSFGGSDTGKNITDFGSSDVAKAIVLQSDPSNLGGSPLYIDVAGYSNNNFAVARYTGAGVLDTTFGTGGKLTTSFASGSAHGAAIALQNDGKVVVAGYDNGQFALARYATTGTLDSSFGAGGEVLTSFGAGANASGYAMAIDYSGTSSTNPNYGTIVVGGSDSGNFALARYNANGTLDTNFGSGSGEVVAGFGAYTSGSSLAIQGDGNILLAGAIDQSAALGFSNFALTRYLPGGQIDASFGTNGTAVTDFGGYDVGHAVTLQPDPNNPSGPPSAIYAAGFTYAGGSSLNFAIAKYTASGALNTGFGVGGKAVVGVGVSNDQGNGIVLRPDGSVVVVGSAYGNVGVYNNDFASAAFLPDDTVTIMPYVPAATLSGASIVPLNQPYNLQLTAAYPQNDPDGGTDSANWTVDWGDGTSPSTAAGNSSSLSHLYAAAGVYAVTARTAEMTGGGAVQTVLVDGGPTLSAVGAAPNPTYGVSTQMSVNGGDMAGTNTLTYTWSATSLPAGASAPIFSDNGDNIAKNAVATFSSAGNYTFQVTATDGFGLSATASIPVSVAATLTAIHVTPATASILEGNSQLFQATGVDQFGDTLAVQPSFSWSVSNGPGSISAGGLYIAPDVVTAATIRAASGSVVGTAAIAVNNPIVVSASPIRAVVGDLFSGQIATFVDALSAGNPADYTATIAWGDGQVSTGTIVGSGGNSFAVQGSNTYLLPSAIGGAPMTVTVVRAPYSTALASNVAMVASTSGIDITASAGQTFSGAVASFFDPDLHAISSNYAAGIDWGDGGSSTGVITQDGPGQFHVSGTHTYDTAAVFPAVVEISGLLDGMIAVTVSNATVGEAPPTVAQPASAAVSSDGASVSLSVLGADLAGEGDLTYKWSATSGQGATFEQNGNNDSKNTVADLSAAGDYTFNATITDSSGQSTSSSVSVTVDQVESDLLVTPGSPNVAPAGNLQLSARTLDQFGQPMDSQPAFTWTMQSGNGSVSRNRVYVAPDLGPDSAVVAASADGLNDTADIQVSDSTPTLSATAVSSSEIDINYQAPAGHNVELEEQGPSDSNFHTITLPAPSSQNPNACPLTGLNAGAVYQFRLRADINGIATYSNTVTASTFAEVPAAPSEIAASPLSDTSIVLFWQDNSTDETGFDVQRSNDGGATWANLPGQPPNTTTYTDTGLTPGTSYLYQVAARNSAGASTYAQAGANTISASSPLPPSGVSASASSPKTINVSWTNNASDQTGLVLDIFTISGFSGANDVGATEPYQTLALSTSVNLAAGATHYTATVANSYSTDPISAYVFELRSTSSAGTSADSAPSSSVLTPFDTSVTPPGAPSNLQRYTSGGPPPPFYQVTATQPNPNTSTGNQLSVSASPDPTAGGAPAPDVLGWLQSPSTTYTFQERNYNTGGYSSWSNTISYTTGNFSVPPQPTSVVATSTTPGRIDLSWSGSQSGVNDSALVSSNGTYWQNPPITLNADGHSGSITSGLLPGTMYQVRVMAVQNYPVAFRVSSSASVTTAVAPQTVSISAIDPLAAEVGADPGRFLLSRFGSDDTQPLTVPLTVAGSATVGVNYNLVDESGRIIAGASPTATIPASQAAAYVSVVPIRDQAGDPDTTVTATVDDSSPGASGVPVQSNPDGDSASIDIAGVPPLSDPSAPSNLTATPFSTSQTAGVRLLWDNTPNNEDAFIIQRSRDAGQSWTQIAQVASDVTSYVDSSEPAGTACTYRVGAYRGSDSPAWSNLATDPVPDAPSGLSVTADNNADTETLAWTNNASSYDGVEIEWSSDGSNFDTIDTVPAGVSNYVDSDPQSGSGNNNYYRVVTFRNVATMQDGIEESKPSNNASGEPVDPPIAVDDNSGPSNIDGTDTPYLTPKNTPLTVSGAEGVMANDLDPQGLPLTIASYTQPANGTLSMNASDGSFVYTPHTGFSGTDTFTYTLSNGILQSGQAIVAVTVANQPVQTRGDFFTLSASNTVSAAAGALGANDVNPDNAAVTYYVATDSGPRHGTLSFNPDGSFTYVPSGSFAGMDQFSYYVSDGTQESNVSPVVIGSGAALTVPPNFRNPNPPNPATFSNNLKGLWNSYLASKDSLTAVMQAMSHLGGQVQGLAGGNAASDSQLDGAISGLETLYQAYDSYVTQATATLHAAANFMRDVWITTQAKADVLNAITALPTKLACLAPNSNELAEFQSALSDFGDGASIMVGNNGRVVRIAETSHAVAERTIQVLGAASIAGAGIEVLANEGCEAFAAYAAKQIVSLGASLAANAAAQQAVRLATWLAVDPSTVQIAADSIQLLFLIKAARQEQLASNANCFVAGTEVITGIDPTNAGSFSQTPIQDIQVGDEVLTRNQYDPNGPLEERKVLQTYQHTAYALEDVTVKDASGATETIDVTPEHPFYVEGLGWTGSSQLTAGEHLSAPDESTAVVVSAVADPRPAGVTVYNFEVDQDHTYFVDQGAGAVWVHNTCDSYKLGNAMGNRAQHIAAGDQAHHIVAVNDQRADLARQILDDNGIDINDPANGIWLPKADHQGIHTKAYYEKVNDILFDARESKALVLAALRSISAQIANGTFP